ncbi:hypothetical protein CF328_g9509 [Tilletia controversa]|nr:hypothetical protein CF328_g9509 [Tilletia controversa]
MHPVVKKKRPLMTRRYKQNRLRFALKHVEWTPEDWARVIWTDETKINRISSDGREVVWVENGSGLSERTITPTVKFGGGNIMVWGCMTWSGPGKIELVQGRMNAQQYTEILTKNLVPVIDAMSLLPDSPARDKIILQQDNDPKHTAKLAKAWFKAHNITPLEWPANSPDLNPIEHLWNTLKRRLHTYSTQPKGAQELWERVQVEWERLPTDTCKGLIESMPRRCAAVIRAKGGNTKY